jgi:ABC-type lipoprotein release transport system permease subunit
VHILLILFVLWLLVASAAALANLLKVVGMLFALVVGLCGVVFLVGMGVVARENVNDSVLHGVVLVGAVLLSRYMVSIFLEFRPTDAWAYVTVSLLLAAIATLASYLPARRAATVDLTQALRLE